jgi:hypothetical protein
MKKTSILVVLLTCAFSSFSQIQLEHSYNSWIGEFDTNTTTMYFEQQGFSTEANQFNIYNNNHTLYKTIILDVPDGYYITSINFPSINIYNSSSNIEFIVAFTKISASGLDNYRQLIRLFDENSNLLYDFGNAFSFYPLIIKTKDGQNKLKIIRYNYTETTPATLYYISDFYQLVGTSNSTTSNKPNIKSFAFPNPSNSFVNLPYEIENGKNTIMRIYNINGRLIETYRIDFNSNNLKIDISDYSSGVYFYEYNGISNRFIVN